MHRRRHYSSCQPQCQLAGAEIVDEAINKFGCTACHTIGEGDADIGPNLSAVGSRLSVAKLRESIMNPNAVIAKGFDEDIMPDDFSEQMKVKELEMIVEFLAKQGGK